MFLEVLLLNLDSIPVSSVIALVSKFEALACFWLVLWDKLLSGEDEGEQDEKLEDGLSEDVFGHLLVDDVFVSTIWWSVK